MKIGFLVLAASVFAKGAAADLPRVPAKVSWVGECNDSVALEREMRARGVELVDHGGSVSSELELDVRVTTGAAGRRHATLELRSGRGRQRRELDAQQCEELRRAVAWVLVVLAEEEALAANVIADEHPKLAVPMSAPAVAPAAVPAAQSRTRPAELPARQSGPSVPRAQEPRASFRLGTALVTGFGFAPRPALGPSFFVELQPGPKSLALRVALLRLETLPFQRDDTSIEVERLALRGSVGSNAVWSPLSVAANVEVGQLTGSGRGSRVAPGKDKEPWLAFGLSARLDIPLLPRILAAELGASLDYTPLSYSFRYRSGQELSTSGPVEGRAQAGFAARW